MNEKLISIMNDSRIISASENLIFPMLDLMIEQRLEQACARFRGGESQFVSDIAFITALKDIRDGLSSVQKKGLAAFEKLNRENS